MRKSTQRRSRRTVSAPVASRDSGGSQGPLPAWDRRTWLVAIPLALIVIYAFIPTLDNGFVSWDDDQNFLDNPYFRGLGAAQVKWAWTTFWLGVYQPLAWLLFEAQYVFCQLDPRGYHLTSLLLQVANAVVLYVLTVALLVRCRTDSCLESPWTCSLSAGLATALFAVHPLRVEAVAWASCQPYLPCILFSMLSVLAYLRAFRMDSSPRWGWLVGSFFLFVAALLFKAVAVSLPAVLLDPGRLPTPAIWGRDRAMVRGVGAESLVGEGPVCDDEPCLHGPRDRGQAAITGSPFSITTPRKALPRRATRSGFTS